MDVVYGILYVMDTVKMIPPLLKNNGGMLKMWNI